MMVHRIIAIGDGNGAVHVKDINVLGSTHILFIFIGLYPTVSHF